MKKYFFIISLVSNFAFASSNNSVSDLKEGAWGAALSAPISVEGIYFLGLASKFEALSDRSPIAGTWSTVEENGSISNPLFLNDSCKVRYWRENNSSNMFLKKGQSFYIKDLSEINGKIEFKLQSTYSRVLAKYRPWKLEVSCRGINNSSTIDQLENALEDVFKVSI